MKKCNKCKKKKQLDDFYKISVSNDKRFSYCKDCLLKERWNKFRSVEERIERVKNKKTPHMKTFSIKQSNKEIFKWFEIRAATIGKTQVDLFVDLLKAYKQIIEKA